MCSIDSKEEGREVERGVLLEKVRKEVKNHDSINFTGGEPTVHSDIIKLVKEAEKQGYKKITLSTNGRMFADKRFAAKMIDSGLKSVALTLHGEEKVHDQVTGRTGSFREALEGICNLRKCGASIHFRLVLMKNNKNSLPLLVKRLGDLNTVTSVGIQELLLRKDTVKSNAKKVALSFKEKKQFFLKNLFSLSSNIPSMIIGFFPRCTLPVQLPPNVSHLPKMQKEKNWDFKGLSNTSPMESVKIASCSKCPFSRRCSGFNKEDMGLFGEKNAEEMIKMDDFLEKVRPDEV